MYHKQMREAIREERRQSQNDLAALIELERVIRKELVDRD